MFICLKEEKNISSLINITRCGSSPRMTLVGTAVNFGEKMKIYPQVLTFFKKPQIWLFHLVDLQTTTKKRTKAKKARSGCAKLLFLPIIKICKFVTFSLPSLLS